MSIGIRIPVLIDGKLVDSLGEAERRLKLSVNTLGSTLRRAGGKKIIRGSLVEFNNNPKLNKNDFLESEAFHNAKGKAKDGRGIPVKLAATDSNFKTTKFDSIRDAAEFLKISSSGLAGKLKKAKDKECVRVGNYLVGRINTDIDWTAESVKKHFELNHNLDADKYPFWNPKLGENKVRIISPMVLVSVDEFGEFLIQLLPEAKNKINSALNFAREFPNKVKSGSFAEI